MNRPFAFVCGYSFADPEQNGNKLDKYCRELYSMGYTPIAPNYLFPRFLNLRIAEERKGNLEMTLALLRKCRVLVICGKRLSDEVLCAIQLANKLKIPATTIDGMRTVKGHISLDGQEAAKGYTVSANYVGSLSATNVESIKHTVTFSGEKVDSEPPVKGSDYWWYIVTLLIISSLFVNLIIIPRIRGRKGKNDVKTENPTTDENMDIGCDTAAAPSFPGVGE